MGHISELALFDYLAEHVDLSAQEMEHLQDCDDCRDLAVKLRRIIQETSDVAKTRRFLAEEGALPIAGEPAADFHEEQRELDETSG